MLSDTGDANSVKGSQEAGSSHPNLALAFFCREGIARRVCREMPNLRFVYQSTLRVYSGQKLLL